MAGPGNQISHAAVDPSLSEEYYYGKKDYYQRAFASKKTTKTTQTQTGGGAAGGGVWGQNPASKTPCDIPGQPCSPIGSLGGTANWCQCVAAAGTTTAPSDGGGGGGSGILGGLFNAFCGNCGGGGGGNGGTTTAGNGSAAAAAADTGGCSLTAFVDKGNSPGWYTAGANASGGSGWGGSSGHHHCDWKSPCCFCTDPPKCIKSGTPPQTPGSCRPDWGTQGYLGGGPYPTNADFSKCPPGTAPTGAALARAYATKKKSTTTTPTPTITAAGGGAGVWGQNPASKTPCDIPGQSCPTIGALGGTNNWCKCIAGGATTTTTTDTTTGAAPTTTAAAPSHPCIPFLCDSQSHFNLVIIIIVVILLLLAFKVIK